MDQVHLPDPISNDIRELQADNIRMQTDPGDGETHAMFKRESDTGRKRGGEREK